VPARLKRIIAIAAEYGITVSPPNRGSHWKAKKGGHIQSLCRNFGLNVDEFTRKL
jgi:hypothetical protein